MGHNPLNHFYTNIVKKSQETTFLQEFFQMELKDKIMFCKEGHVFIAIF